MPRQPRLNVPGGLYHVILRGNARQAIFFDAEDRQRWESYLHAGVQRHMHRIHAYCWMTNHVHLAIQAHAEPLSQFMSFAASQYARSTNRKMRQSGHLFERRHRSILVQTDSYLKELVRYIHHNPLRAAIVDDLRKYAWSSHTAYLGGTCPDWLTVDWVLSMFGNTERAARRRYRDFMQQQQPASVTRMLRTGGEHDSRVLGDDGYRASVLEKLNYKPVKQSLDELVQSVCKQHEVSEDELAQPSRFRKHSKIRAEIGLLALEHGIASVTEVARRFGRSQPALSRTMTLLRNNRE